MNRRYLVCLSLLIACQEPASPGPLPLDGPTADDLQTCGGVGVGVLRMYYLDEDGDGFGNTNRWSCTQDSGYVLRRGDCDDAVRDVHPGAPDESGDGIDSDCGGSDDPQPHVGLSENSAPLDQALVDQLSAGETLWIGPGTYQVTNLELNTYETLIRSTDQAEETVLDGGQVGRIATVREGRLAMDGFTFQHGAVGNVAVGGGLYAKQADLHLVGCIFQENTAGSGGAIYLEGGTVTLESLLALANTATGEGGGVVQAGYDAQVVANNLHLRNNTSFKAGGAIGLGSGTFTLTDAILRDNQAQQGGALYGTGAHLTLQRALFTTNDAGQGGALCWEGEGVLEINTSTLSNNSAQEGGGIYLLGPVSTSLVDTHLNTNTAKFGAGGIQASGATLKVRRSYVEGNLSLAVAPQSGTPQTSAGGLDFGQRSDLAPGSVEITNTVFVQNSAASVGAMALANLSSLKLEHNTFALNQGQVAGALKISSGQTEGNPGCILRNNIFAYNSQGEITVEGDGLFAGSPNSFQNNLLYHPGGVAVQGITPDISTIYDEPDFIALGWEGGLITSPDLHLRPRSPALDAGVEGFLDPDGSRADLGAFGGPDADRSYMEDLDQDGMWDGWETTRGLDLSLNDADIDADSDGLANQDEFSHFSDPFTADVDNDGYLDGAEVEASSSPTDWYQIPGDLHRVALVPGSFDTLQEAIDHVWKEGHIRVDGPIAGGSTLKGKVISVEGTSREGSVILATDTPALVVTSATLTLNNLTLQGGTTFRGGALDIVDGTLSTDGVDVIGGQTTHGGGIYAERSLLNLSSSRLSDGVAESGGGAYLFRSQLTAEGSFFTGNTAQFGGGLALDHSQAELPGSVVETNLATSGGGLWLNNSSLDFAIIHANQAAAGGGLYVGGETRLGQIHLDGNIADAEGGGLLIPAGAEILAEHLSVAHNLAGRYGGGLHVGGHLTGAQFQVYDNTGFAGGGLYAAFGTLEVEQVALEGNVASGGIAGGIYLNESALNFDSSVVAWNRAGPGLENLYLKGGSTFTSNFTIWYGPHGAGTDVTPVGLTDMVADPAFVNDSRDGSGLDDDLHLASTSGVLDLGNPGQTDPDGSRGDAGAFGGAGAAQWDIDGDGLPQRWDPRGSESQDGWDCDDEDPEVGICSSSRMSGR